jgi:hypothetical protein
MMEATVTLDVLPRLAHAIDARAVGLVLSYLS